MRTFTLSDAKSHKFWNIELKGDSFTVTYGRIGTAGQTQAKKFASAAAAQKEHDKMIREKVAKGYHETTPPSASSGGGSLRQALEAAILDNPDDLAAHMAYADHLQEQGDPQGEFIQVQLALEDPEKSADERKKLRQQEKALLKKYEAQWAGDWPPLVRSGGPEGRGQHDFAGPKPLHFIRGIAAEATLDEVPLKAARAFVRSPQTRLVRRLFVGGFASTYYEQGYADEEAAHAEEGAEQQAAEPPGDYPQDAAYPSEHVFLRWPYFANLRVFQLGWTSDEVYDDFCNFQCHLDGERAYDLVKQMPRLEELYLFAHDVPGSKIFALPMPNLRVLQLYHSCDYALGKLAKNPSMGRLTHLLCHPHALDYGVPPYIRLAELRAVVKSPHLTSLTHLRLRLTDFGDRGCEEIVRSGILRRLKVLDLRHGRVSDKGAGILADCPDLKNLELLDLSRNELTADGIAALKASGIPIETGYQHESTADAEDSRDMEYLGQGDYE